MVDEKNPLEIHTSISCKSSLQRNKRGRPTSGKVVNFSAQPKSIISKLLLNKTKGKNCNSIREQIHLSDGAAAASNSKCNLKKHKNSDSKIQPDLSEDIQGRYTIHLPSSEDCNEYDSLNDSSSLLNNDQYKHQGHLHADMKKENESKLCDIICYVCSHRSSTHQDHRNHFTTHRNQLYKCNFPDCSYTSKSSSNLIKHKRIHTAEKPYLCDQCTFRSNFVNSLKVHKRTHTCERPFGCKFCSYRCNSSSNLKKHCFHRHSEIS